MFGKQYPWYNLMVLIRLSFCGSVPLRLINGPGICAGRVEVFYKDIWGSVCDDSWDSRDAQVVCSQLKCGVALSAPTNAFFGQSNGTIWMDDVKCIGTESDISICPHSGWGNHNCGQFEAASAVCSEILPKPTISIVTLNQSFELQCTVPKLLLNLTVYILNTQTNTTLSIKSILHNQLNVDYKLSEQEKQGIALYACQYETWKKNVSYISPLSDPVCVVHSTNGSHMINISENVLSCASSAATSTWTAITPTSAQIEDGTVMEQSIVMTISLIVAFAVVLLILLVIFFAYRRRPNNFPEAHRNQGNQYIDCEDILTKSGSPKGQETKLKEEPFFPTYVNQEPIYETIDLPNDGKHEIRIFSVENTSLYESLEEATKSRDIYEVLQ